MACISGFSEDPASQFRFKLFCLLGRDLVEFHRTLQIGVHPVHPRSRIRHRAQDDRRRHGHRCHRTRRGRRCVPIEPAAADADFVT